MYYERYNGHYGEGVFVLANFLSSFPFLVMITLSSATIIFYMVKFHMGFSIYCYFCINLFCCLSTMESITMIVALLVPNFLMGIGVTSAVIVSKRLQLYFYISVACSLEELMVWVVIVFQCRCFWRLHLDFIGHWLIFPRFSGNTQWAISVLQHGLCR